MVKHIPSPCRFPGLTLALLAVVLVGALAVAQPSATVPIAPDFNREVRPILANHCLKCHGPDENNRMAGLRLDTAEGAAATLGSGKRAVVPGKPEASEILQRIYQTDSRQMPPAHANKPLSDTQKEILYRWIVTGGAYQPHWAFVAPKQNPLPPVHQKEWVRNPIDHFVLAQMESVGLTPAPEADRYTLVRRLYLDLIGLPPTPEEADLFVQDTAPGAYEKLVDRLLASPRYGERWARPWLDLARYADTNGYEKDRPRSIYPYRDWVIKALNADMPFDQFTVRQIAGDMLPQATVEDQIATGFHRNTMRNEEGGNDPLEYRFHAVNDRVATTGTTWLGLTLGCAQCHTHKYDPVTQIEYYQLFAFLNNADEVDLDVPSLEMVRKRGDAEREAMRRTADLPNRFPASGPVLWNTTPMTVQVASGATATPQPDGSVLVGGAESEHDTYTVTLTGDGKPVSALQIETLTDPSLGSNGPGRTPHGNFVLNAVVATVTPPGGKQQRVRFGSAESDIAQEGWPAHGAIDDKADTGWAVHVPGKTNQNHWLTLRFPEPVQVPAGSVWTVALVQSYGGKHTIGRFRVRLGSEVENPRSLAARRREQFHAAFQAWQKPLAEKAVRWTVIKPTRATSEVPILRILPDSSVLSTSDITKHDVYTVELTGLPVGIRALRLEALPHPSLPAQGPGRVYYEGVKGDFWCNELTATTGGKPVLFTGGIASFGSGAALVDGQADSGWSANGNQGKTQVAVLTLAEPLTTDRLTVQMTFERYYASALGRFRFSVTTDSRAGTVALLPEIEEVLATPEAERTAKQRATLVQAFCAVAPELAGERAEIERIRRSAPAFPTTLVFAERPADNPRKTFRHHRGEFTQPREDVQPGTLSVLPPLPKDAPRNRLTFARWLVSRENPLTARVTVNRHWAAFYGRGIVRTTEDFGFQGDPPTHPELLDWLAVEFMQKGWSVKRLHRLIVTSATYRQSSASTAAKREKDPENKWLSWLPRTRMEAERIRDTVLTAAGLLSPKMYGPSVFPPQPPGVTTEGAYGPLPWNVSEGEDRYRRGLYTFSKRTAPYAMFATFDAPSGEATCPRRETSNTPLQALTLLNGEAFVEAAQALGRLTAAHPGTDAERLTYLFRRILTRPPTEIERATVLHFYTTQQKRLTTGSLKAAPIAGLTKTSSDSTDRAAWTLVARALLNTDEAIVRR